MQFAFVDAAAILLVAKNAAAMASAIATATVLRPASAAIATVPRRVIPPRVVPWIVVPLLLVPAARSFPHAPWPPVLSLMRRPHRPSGPRCTRPCPSHPSPCAGSCSPRPSLRAAPLLVPARLRLPSILVTALSRPDQRYVSCWIKKGTNK